MDPNLLLILNLIVAIFCFVTGFFLFFKYVKERKSLILLFSIYFIAEGMSLFFGIFYQLIPNLSDIYLKFLMTLSGLIAFFGILSLLISTYYLNSEMKLNQIIGQIFFSLCCLGIIIFLYSINVVNLPNQTPEVSWFYAFWLFLCYIIPYIFCIINLRSNSLFRTRNTLFVKKSLTIFFSLSIILTFTNIMGFFRIHFDSYQAEFSFLNIFVLLFLIQGFIIVYILPIQTKKNIYLN